MIDQVVSHWAVELFLTSMTCRDAGFSMNAKSAWAPAKAESAISGVVTGGFVEASSQASAPLSGHSHSRPCSTCTPMDKKNSQKVSWLPG